MISKLFLFIKRIKFKNFLINQKSKIIFPLVWLFISFLVCLITCISTKDIENRHVYSDVSTHVMIASSIWNDFDLEYSLDDLSRFRIDYPSESGPKGLYLKTDQKGNLVYAKPHLYGAVSSIFYGINGINGFIFINSICIFLIGLITATSLSRALGYWWGLFISIGFVLPSPFLAWVSVPHPDLFVAALLAGTGYILLREHNTKFTLVFGSFLLAAVIHEKPTFITLVPFILLYLFPKVTIRKIFLLISWTLFLWMIFSLPNFISDGTLFSYQGTRFYVLDTPFPLEQGWIQPERIGFSDHLFNPIIVLRSFSTNILVLPEKLFDFIVGRQTGILVYFPVAFALIINRFFSGQKNGLILIAGFFTHLTFNWLVFPTNGYGGSGSYGSRYMMQVIPLIPFAFIEGRPRHIISTRISIIVMMLLALLIHWKIPIYGENLVKEYYRWFLEKPLSFFPVERLLLPYTSRTYRLPFTEELPSTEDFLFHMNFINDGYEFEENENYQELSSILFVNDRDKPIRKLELNSICDRKVIFKQGKKIVWEGLIQNGQPVQLDIYQDDYLYDLFNPITMKHQRFYTFTVSSDPTNNNVLCRYNYQSIRFINDYKRFDKYDEFISVENFRKDEVFLGFGWSDVEYWGVWSEDEIAEILLYTNESPETYEARFVLIGYNPKEDDTKNINLWVNGHLLKKFVIEKTSIPNEFTFKFETMPGEEFLQIIFEIENPASPTELGISSDNRRLGVGLIGFSLMKIEMDSIP